MQDRATVDDLSPLDAVHSHRQVVCGAGMRLQQHGMDIEVRSHIPGNGQPVRCLPIDRCAYPAAGEQARPILDREQYTASGRFGQIDDRCVARFVTTFVQREREHCGSRRIALAGMSPPVGPVNEYRAACSVPALRVAYEDEVFAPCRILQPERHLGTALGAFQCARCDDHCGGALYVTVQSIGRAFLPPAPVEPIDFILQISFRQCIALGIQCHDGKVQIAIGFKFTVAQPDADIRIVWRVAHRSRRNAFIAARLDDTGDQIGL